MTMISIPNPRLIFAVFLVLGATRPALAQDATSRSKLIVINTLIGGSTAAITAAIRHRPVRRAFFSGAAGGLIVFGGKCLVSQKKNVTDWLGQETVAIGSSVVANAATGRGAFERVVIAIGPLRIYRDTKARRNSVKLDLLQTGVAAYYSVNAATSVDWRASSTHGALILYDADAPTEFEVGGVVKTWNVNWSLLVHELTHVAQEQFVTTALEEPLEGWMLPAVPGGNFVHRYFELGSLAPLWAAANATIPRTERPWEREAGAFSDYC